MLKAKDFRSAAWKSLRGKWGTFALITLIYFIILGACAALTEFYGLGTVIQLLFAGSLSAGIAGAALKTAGGETLQKEASFT